MIEKSFVSLFFLQQTVWVSQGLIRREGGERERGHPPVLNMIQKERERERECNFRLIHVTALQFHLQAQDHVVLFQGC